MTCHRKCIYQENVGNYEYTIVVLFGFRLNKNEELTSTKFSNTIYSLILNNFH